MKKNRRTIVKKRNDFLILAITFVLVFLAGISFWNALFKFLGI